MKKVLKTISVSLIILLMLLSVLTGYYIYNLPNSYYVQNGNELKLSCFFDITAQSNQKSTMAQSSKNSFGEKVSLKLFNVIPIKDVTVKQVERSMVIPGGNPFGIKIVTDGVMIIGISDVDTSKGSISPAKEAGLENGDIIISINGDKNVTKENVLGAFMESQGEKISMIVRRDSKILNVMVEPQYSLNDNCYKAGMWVRDSAAGIGTITYYDPTRCTFGGLGHPICDSDTGNILPIKSGNVVGVTINGVNKGKAGQPGELIGNFTSNFKMGDLKINNQSGLFGYLNSPPSSAQPIELAFKQEVKEGKATILTTIDGSTPKEYDIEIERVDFKGNELSKNMVIHITDSELLAKSGGIVQGMSGSPIIQNGRLVGAVTHVFVNDPTRGYGIFAETMFGYSSAIRNNAA